MSDPYSTSTEPAIDPELQRLGAVAKQLTEMQDAERDRAMRYLAGRFTPTTPEPAAATRAPRRQRATPAT